MSEYVIDLDELADLEHEANAYAEWQAGKVRPWRITTALNLRGLYGPEVDVACLAVEPEVDWWEEAILYPTWDQLLALAGLTDMLPGWFTRAGDPPVTTTVFLCTSGRGGGCHVIEPPAVVHLTYSADVVAATVGVTS